MSVEAKASKVLGRNKTFNSKCLSQLPLHSNLREGRFTLLMFQRAHSMLAWPCVLGQNFMTMGAYGRESSSSHCGQERERQDVLRG